MKIILDEADITSAPELFANLIRELAKPQKEAPAQENWSTVIRVKRSELKQRLIDDGIIKP